MTSFGALPEDYPWHHYMPSEAEAEVCDLCGAAPRNPPWWMPGEALAHWAACPGVSGLPDGTTAS